LLIAALAALGRLSGIIGCLFSHESTCLKIRIVPLVSLFSKPWCELPRHGNRITIGTLRIFRIFAHLTFNFQPVLSDMKVVAFSDEGSALEREILLIISIMKDHC
jgi:hypothetical protein